MIKSRASLSTKIEKQRKYILGVTLAAGLCGGLVIDDFRHDYYPPENTYTKTLDEIAIKVEENQLIYKNIEKSLKNVSSSNHFECDEQSLEKIEFYKQLDTIFVKYKEIVGESGVVLETQKPPSLFDIGKQERILVKEKVLFLLEKLVDICKR